MRAQSSTMYVAHAAGGAPRAIAARLAAQLGPADGSLVLLFASSHVPGAELVAAMDVELPGATVVGCTTSGEISPAGFHDHSAVALSLGPDVAAAVRCVHPLSTATPLDARRALEEARAELIGSAGAADGSLVGLVLIDGLQRQEEMWMAWLAAAAAGLPLVGASASDDFAFRETHVFCDGEAHVDAALLVLLRTRAPFHLLKLHHFRTTPHRVVVTGADPSQRVVTELDGYPAIEVYARLLGEPAEALQGEPRFLPPFGFLLGEEPYIRSVMRVEQGVGLRFACAVEEGVPLTLMEPGDLVASTRDGLAQARRAVGGELRGMIAFNCLGRLFEARETGRVDELAGLFRDLPVAGFHTYGEQYFALHVNHTLTGLVIGAETAS